MVAVSSAKDAKRAVLTRSDTYSLVILPQWKVPIRSARERSISNHEIRTLEKEYFLLSFFIPAAKELEVIKHNMPCGSVLGGRM